MTGRTSLSLFSGQPTLCPLERADHIIARPLGERCWIPFLTRAGLIGGRDATIEGDVLTQARSSRQGLPSEVALVPPKPIPRYIHGPACMSRRPCCRGHSAVKQLIAAVELHCDDAHHPQRRQSLRQ